MAGMQMQSKYRAVLVGLNLVVFSADLQKMGFKHRKFYLQPPNKGVPGSTSTIIWNRRKVSKLVASFIFTNWIFSLDQIFLVHTEIIGCLILFLSHILVCKSVSSWLLSLWLTQYARLSSSFHDRRKGVYFSKGIGD